MGKGVKNPSYRKRIGYQAGLLGGMALLAAAALVIGDNRTRADIAARAAEDRRASLSQVIPGELHDNNLLADTVTVPAADGDKTPLTAYQAVRGGRVSGVAFEVVGQGYGGPIRLLLGVDRSGELLGVRVLSHAETPGLGDKIEITRDDWILSFDGRSLENTTEQEWAVKKDGGRFDQFTGATITPRAIVNAVHAGLQRFARQRNDLLRYSPPAADTPVDATSGG